MASLIPGYEYDIFISYRQKDNKHDGWVTKFVDNLKGELEATFKEDVSVYFDENPHDRLQETHNVDKSLEGKLKCLIFIPILSQTYCDPNSYAWQNEFLSFLKMVENDRFGKDVRLRSGNVASRILPIRIHDLEHEDIKLFEKETGSMLRAMDFVFKTSTGVIRPLLQNEDHPNDNLNKTFYRDQISKVAIAIKDIIAALGQHEQKSDVVQKEISKPAAIPRKNNKTKIIVGSVILLALIFIGYFFIHTLSKPKEQLEKSIAVLPFRNDSPSDSTTYFIDGIMEEILNSLQRIGAFNKVLSRTSTEQYRGVTKSPIPKIAENLGVNYIVEGSGQKYGNFYRIRVQLIEGKIDKHLWAESYEREIKSTNDIFRVQNEIAQSIASELNATITPEEKQLLEKVSTNNLTAYDLYQRGEEEIRNYWSDNNNKQALKKAKELYDEALKLDSTFAKAYIGLAYVYVASHYFETFYKTEFLDSMLILANLAILYDERLSPAYYTRADYYLNKGETDRAITEIDKAIKYNPNYWEAYVWKGYNIFLNSANNSDYVEALEYFNKAININRGKELPFMMRELGLIYSGTMGFFEKGIFYINEALKLDGDSIKYLSYLSGIPSGLGSGSEEEDIKLAKRSYEKDTNNIYSVWQLALCYFGNDHYDKESLKFWKKYVEMLKSIGQTPQGYEQYIGYAYWQNGYRNEANYWFNESRKLGQESIKLGRAYKNYPWTYYNFAHVYAFTGEKEKAYEMLEKTLQYKVFPYFMVNDIKSYNPLFKYIRSEPRFQKIVKEMEVKYQAEHERVRKWLEDNNML